jgi:hypothetical protein
MAVTLFGSPKRQRVGALVSRPPSMTVRSRVRVGLSPERITPHFILDRNSHDEASTAYSPAGKSKASTRDSSRFSAVATIDSVETGVS